MTRIRHAAILTLALGAAALSPARGAGDRLRPRIEGLETRRAGETLFVSFRLADVLSEQVLERIRSGLPLSFEHVIEVTARRAVPLWFPRVLSRTRVETDVSYETLTRQYHLTRRIETRPRKAEPERREEQLTTESAEAMRSWMTEVTEVPLADVPSTPRARLRVESTLGRRYVLLLFPSRMTVTAEERLEP